MDPCEDKPCFLLERQLWQLAVPRDASVFCHRQCAVVTPWDQKQVMTLALGSCEPECVIVNGNSNYLAKQPPNILVLLKLPGHRRHWEEPTTKTRFFEQQGHKAVVINFLIFSVFSHFASVFSSFVNFFSSSWESGGHTSGCSEPGFLHAGESPVSSLWTWCQQNLWVNFSVETGSLSFQGVPLEYFFKNVEAFQNKNSEDCCIRECISDESSVKERGIRQVLVCLFWTTEVMIFLSQAGPTVPETSHTKGMWASTLWLFPSRVTPSLPPAMIFIVYSNRAQAHLLSKTAPTSSPDSIPTHYLKWRVIFEVKLSSFCNLKVILSPKF